MDIIDPLIGALVAQIINWMVAELPAPRLHLDIRVTWRRAPW
ncbi:hypothetical protein [Paractinoplanes deccanensis]|nr:hypothetical protein [Actinoplanes deccanensis]